MLTPTSQSTIAKLQILTLTAKMLVLSPATPQLNSISLYLASLARYDADYDVRDRSRFLHALLRGVRDENRSVNEEDTEGAVETEEDMGGVILRREQVRVVLLGKREDADVVVAKSELHVLDSECQVHVDDSTRRRLRRRLDVPHKP